MFLLGTSTSMVLIDVPEEKVEVVQQLLDNDLTFHALQSILNSYGVAVGDGVRQCAVCARDPAKVGSGATLIDEGFPAFSLLAQGEVPARYFHPSPKCMRQCKAFIDLFIALVPNPDEVPPAAVALLLLCATSSYAGPLTKSQSTHARNWIKKLETQRKLPHVPPPPPPPPSA